MSLLIPNATVELNSFSRYEITPNEGYVMHDKNYDIPIFDENTMEVTDYMLGYRPTTASIHINRDLSAREMLDEAGNTVTAYTEREFFCKLITDVPENQIFGGGNNNDHEIM